MTTPTDEAREELADLLRETRLHLAWLADSGVRWMRAETAAPPSAFASAVPSSVARPAVAAPPAARPAIAAAVPVPAPTRPVALPETPMPRAAAASAAITAKKPAPIGLPTIREEIGDCRRCGLCSTRTNIVFGQGNPQAEVVFLGEGPGEDEDLSGLAFVGRAGQLLTKMIEAMGYTRDDVYICNIVKCRPPGNRRPEPEEIESCRPFVEQQIRTIRPKAVVALGATATQALLRTEVTISKLRNEWHDWEGIAVMPTFHPSYLLRAPQEKAKAWDDLQKVMTRLGRKSVPGK